MKISLQNKLSNELQKNEKQEISRKKDKKQVINIIYFQKYKIKKIYPFAFSLISVKAGNNNIKIQN